MMSVAGFLHLESGTVNLLDGGPFDPSVHAGRITILPQDSELPLEGRPLELLTHYGLLQGLAPQEAARSASAMLEEVHLGDRLNSPIRSLADLNGKRVVEGPDGSGTWVSVQVIKTVTGLKWSTYNFTVKDGVKAVQQGSADAMFMVGGKPIAALAQAQGLRLVPIANPKLDSFGYYTKTLIPSGTYGWQHGAVQTYKINDVLAIYAFKNQYQKEIGSFVSCIARNISNLQRTGHPKWRDVDPLAIDSIKWPAHPAAVSAIKRELKAAR
jgi:TRAP transporter TAXI family solute receptor